jgi:hypothetical protein
MLLGVITRIVGIELEKRVLQIIVGALIYLEVEMGGQNNEDNQGRGNKEHGGGNDEQGGSNNEQRGASHDKKEKKGRKGRKRWREKSFSKKGQEIRIFEEG